MSKTLLLICLLLSTIPSYANYHKGDKATYEKVIYNVHTGRGERSIVSMEIQAYNKKTQIYTIEQIEQPLANNSSAIKTIIQKNASELISTSEVKTRLANCTNAMKEEIRYDHGYIPTCRASNDNQYEIIWYANIPFGFAHYEIYDENKMILTKFMLHNFNTY